MVGQIDADCGVTVQDRGRWYGKTGFLHFPNDLVVQHRKISGSGAGEIGDCIVFVGNVILDFDFELMSRVLKIPDEKFRDKLKKTIEENLSTIRRELGEEALGQWDEEILNAVMAEEFEKLLGPFKPAQKDKMVIDQIQDLEYAMMADEWLYMRGKHVLGRVIKVRSGLKVLHRVHKSAGGLIRADFTVDDGRYIDVFISGDYFCFPSDTVDRIAASLEGHLVNDVLTLLTDFYARQDFEIPGVAVDDWMQVFKPE